MKSVRFPRKFRVYLPLIVVFAVLVFIMPKTAKLTFDYKKGSPWMYETLVAQFDFPVLKTEAQIQQERDKAWGERIPYYRHNKNVLRDVEKTLEETDLESYSYLKADFAAFFNRLYDRGVIYFEPDTIKGKAGVPLL